MDEENERPRRREQKLEDRVARLEAQLGDVLLRPGQGQRTSAPSIGLLFAAAEKTRMRQIITDPNRSDNSIVFANRAFQKLCGSDAAELIGRNCRFLQGPGTNPADVAKVRDAVAARRDVVVEILNYHRDGSLFMNPGPARGSAVRPPRRKHRHGRRGRRNRPADGHPCGRPLRCSAMSHRPQASMPVRKSVTIALDFDLPAIGERPVASCPDRDLSEPMGVPRLFLEGRRLVFQVHREGAPAPARA